MQHGVVAHLYEATDRPGGLIASAIQPFSVPEEVLASDLKILREMGVRFRPAARNPIASCRPFRPRGGLP